MASKLAYRARNALRRGGYELVRSSRAENLLALHLSHLFERYDINCVLDVGARQGEFGWWLRGNGYGGRIVSYEPLGTNLGGLYDATAADPDWQVAPIALGSSETTLAMNVTHYSHYSSFRMPDDAAVERFQGHPRVVATEEVPVRRLENVFDDAVAGIAEPRVYLKLDTQGWDLEVLRGAESRLPEIVAVQSEMSFQAIYRDMPSFDEAWEVVRGYGYMMSGMFPITVDKDLCLVEADCVALRRDAATG